MKLSDPYNVSEFRPRATLVAILFASLIGILILRLWYLQIWKGEEYRQFSDRNRFKIERLSAPRGQILDRNGQLIADSRPRFDLLYTRGNANDVETELHYIKDILKWSDEEFKKRLTRVKNAPRYQPQKIASDLSSDALALIESMNLELPGVDIEVMAVRDYLYKEAFFHVLGYTGEINDQNLERFRRKYPEENYRLGDQIGIMGLEGLHERKLRGRDGSDFIVVDVRGRRVNQEKWELLPRESRVEPVAGHTLQLSLDLQLQLEAAKAFAGKTGAVVALDPSNGEVLAYYSNPSLDPNVFTSVVSTKKFQELTKDVDDPFLDRVVGEHYPPGSTLKIAMAIAALETGVIDVNTHYFCPGYFRFGRRVWKCHLARGHGSLNVIQAIERSCDVFFYNTGLALGLDAMFTWTSRLGFGRRTFAGFEHLTGKSEKLPRFNSEQPGFLPSVEWVEEKGHTSIEAETINAAIGQGAFTVTAMQLARMLTVLGNNGKVFQPQFVRSIHKPNGELEETLTAKMENEIILDPKVREIVLKGLQQVVEGSDGTARGSRLPGIEFGGKTGTAQVVSLELSKRSASVLKYKDHGLFIGMAPLTDPKIAVAVIVENGGHGGTTAAPVAKALIKNYLSRQQVKADDGNFKN